MSDGRRSFRIVFMGTPDFAVPPLVRMADGPDEVVAVVTQPDRARGRGQKVTISPVKAAALERGIEVLQPERIKGKRGAEFRARMEALAPELIVVAAYGKILPVSLLELPTLDCINVHASLLPRWRGASPLHHALLAGDTESGVSIMRMEEGLDTGPVFLKRAIPVGEETDCADLHDRLADLGAEALMEALELFRAGPVEPEAQDDALATYAPMLDKKDGCLDFGASALELARRVRALHPWPGTYTGCRGKLLKVLAAKALATPSGAAPGTVTAATDAGIDVACGEGTLRLSRVQLAGKRVMDAADLVNGRGVEAGDLLSDPDAS
ncbi:MAG: methionyl-tRNA formyltransferase [Deltaproteobacteria bacterium]|nr:methionyl-tRNA formyltransferase [Deltaproteobacteria bacterium]